MNEYNKKKGMPVLIYVTYMMIHIVFFPNIDAKII